MAMSTVNEFKGHGCSAVNGVHVTTSRTEATVTTESNIFPFAAVRATVHGTAIRSIAAMNHFINIFDDNVTGM